LSEVSLERELEADGTTIMGEYPLVWSEKTSFKNEEEPPDVADNDVLATSAGIDAVR
jgi:hypothetical protein